MTAEVWVAIFGFLTAAVGGVRWLLSVYYRQNQKIEDLRSSNEHLAIQQLNLAVENMKDQIRGHRADMMRAQEQMTKMQARIASVTTDGEAIMKTLGEYIEATMARMNKMESQIIELSRRFILIKGGTNGPTNK